tara:strand:- start:2061 stop:2540 length:480 start_codon:yes stop_codon:yes gene_type:complete
LIKQYLGEVKDNNFMKNTYLIILILLIPSFVIASEKVKEKRIAKYIMENIQKDYLDCYSFYKVAAESFKKAGKEKSVVSGLENSADVSLKYNYDLGEIMGLNPKVMAEMTKDKVSEFVKLANKDFSSLAQTYGLMCKGLVENPEQRTRYWENKGAKIIK